MTPEELAVLQSNTYWVTERIKVENGSGTMIDLTAWLEHVQHDRDIDQPVSSLTASFRRDFGPTLSLAPLRTDSTLNRDDMTSYAPQLDAGRDITWEVATTAMGVTPIESDYKLLFKGAIDRVEWESSPVVVTARDEGGLLVDTWIEAKRILGSNAGTPLETVMQQVLDTVHQTLKVEGTPNFLVRRYPQQPMSVQDALFTLAQLKGWDSGYRLVGEAR